MDLQFVSAEAAYENRTPFEGKTEYVFRFFADGEDEYAEPENELEDYVERKAFEDLLDAEICRDELAEEFTHLTVTVEEVD